MSRILRRLALVGTGLTGRRIGELAVVPQKTAQRILTDLEGLGLITAVEAGRSRLYTANRAHILWGPVQEILNAQERLEQRIRDVAQAVDKGGSTVAIYGSTARGVDDLGSDIDIVIVWADESDAETRDEMLSAIAECIVSSTGRPSEIVSITRETLTNLVRASDPLVESWRVDAITVSGVSLQELVQDMAS